MIVVRLAAVLGIATLVGACSVRDCGGKADYLEAVTAGSMVVPDGVSLAPANPLYYIPSGGEGEIILSREYQDDRGKTQIACLYEPPRLVQADTESVPAQ